MENAGSLGRAGQGVSGAHERHITQPPGRLVAHNQPGLPAARAGGNEVDAHGALAAGLQGRAQAGVVGDGVIAARIAFEVGGGYLQWAGTGIGDDDALRGAHDGQGLCAKIKLAGAQDGVAAYHGRFRGDGDIHRRAARRSLAGRGPLVDDHAGAAAATGSQRFLAWAQAGRPQRGAGLFTTLADQIGNGRGLEVPGQTAANGQHSHGDGRPEEKFFFAAGSHALQHFDEPADIRIPAAVAQFHRLPSREQHQVFGEITRGRHRRALHQHRHDAYAASQRRSCFQADEVLGVGEPWLSGAVLAGEPVAADHRHHDLGRAERLVDGIDEVQPGLDADHVHEHALPAEVLRQPVKQSASVTCAVFAAIADEDSRHAFLWVGEP